MSRPNSIISPLPKFELSRIKAELTRDMEEGRGWAGWRKDMAMLLAEVARLQTHLSGATTRLGRQMRMVRRLEARCKEAGVTAPPNGHPDQCGCPDCDEQ